VHEPDADVLTVADEGEVRRLVLNRQGSLNALNTALFDALETEIARLREESSVRVVIVTGAGDRAFCAGADLDELADLDANAARDHLGRGQAIFRALEGCGVPVIAAVDGYALGGGFELALASTLIVASERARFGLPEASLGLIPGYGGTQRLPRAIGRGEALRVMLSGDRIDAAEAYRLGLLAAPPVPAGEALATADELARRIEERSPSAVRAILRLTDPLDLDPGLARETVEAGLATASADAREGIAAFREKRPHSFARDRVEAGR